MLLIVTNSSSKHRYLPGITIALSSSSGGAGTLRSDQTHMHTLNVHYHPYQTSTEPYDLYHHRPYAPMPPTPAVREEEEEEETGGDDDEEEDGAWGEGRSTKRHDAPIVPVPPSLNVIEHDPLEVAARRGGWEVRNE